MYPARSRWTAYDTYRALCMSLYLLLDRTSKPRFDGYSQIDVLRTGPTPSKCDTAAAAKCVVLACPPLFRDRN
jgi:hypothetical protein